MFIQRKTFSKLFQRDKKETLEQSIQFILDNLELPYRPNGKTEVERKNFFKELACYSNELAPNSKLYISGGVVRSLLGYLYERVHKELKRYPLLTPQEILENFYTGKKANGKEKQTFTSLEVLGIGSDLDILIDFSPETDAQKHWEILDKLTDFINSAEKFYQLREESDDLKKSLILVGDVKDLNEQLQRPHDRNAIYQGGSSLDWLLFSINNENNSLFEPKVDFRSLSILEDFFNGEVSYYSPIKESAKPSDKQTLRAIRFLLELPGLTFTKQGFETFKSELQELMTYIKTKGNLSDAAKLQLDKMMRNARFQMANNRFLKSNDPVDSLLREFFNLLKNKGDFSLKEFCVNRYIPREREDKGGLREKGLLLSSEVVASRFKSGVFHGTPDIKSTLSMIRNGFFISNQHQGTAAYGPGIYTTTDKGVSEGYASNNNGIILQGDLKNKPLRILDLGRKDVKEFINTLNLQNNDDLFDVLQNEYDIDAIIPESQPTYLVVQNANILKMPKDFSILLKMQLQSILAQVNNPVIGHCLGTTSTWFNAIGWLDKALNNLHPSGGVRKLSILCAGELQEYKLAFYMFVEKLLKQDKVPIIDILTKGYNYWDEHFHSEEGTFWNRFSIAQKNDLPKDFSTSPKQWVELIQKIGAFNRQPIRIYESELLSLIKLCSLNDFPVEKEALRVSFTFLPTFRESVNNNYYGKKRDFTLHATNFFKNTKNLTTEERKEFIETLNTFPTDLNDVLDENSREEHRIRAINPISLMKLIAECKGNKEASIKQLKEIIDELKKQEFIYSYMGSRDWEFIEEHGKKSLDILKSFDELKLAAGLTEKFSFGDVKNLLDCGLLEMTPQDKQTILKMIEILNMKDYGLTFAFSYTAYADVFKVIELIKDLSHLDKIGLLSKIWRFKQCSQYMIFDIFMEKYEEQKKYPTFLEGEYLEEFDTYYKTRLGEIDKEVLHKEIGNYNQRLKKAYPKAFNNKENPSKGVTFYIPNQEDNQ